MDHYRHPTRRQRGIAQNFANQIAQLAAGWQIINDGPELGMGPREGDVLVDLVTKDVVRDGRPVRLGIAMHALDWVDAELDRQKLPKEWLTSGNLILHFQRDGTPTEHSDGLRLDGIKVQTKVEIDTAYGKASAAFTNSQIITGAR